jgi:ferritin-like metal-binding protein YciE
MAHTAMIGAADGTARDFLRNAHAAGSDNARPNLQASLREEEQMAKWIDANVEKVTLAYLNREVRAAA